MENKNPTIETNYPLCDKKTTIGPMMNEQNNPPELSELGRKSEYDSHYNPKKLFPIPRSFKRLEINIPDALPFFGVDVWTHYEVSWLNAKGKPIVAIAEISYDCASPNIIESKSMKLYFNSLNNTQFENKEDVQKTLERDLTQAVGSTVDIKLYFPEDMEAPHYQNSFTGILLDTLDIECQQFEPDPAILKTLDGVVSEVLTSNLLKSNCLVTFQPDWGSVQISYSGRQICHESLLKYLVSFRNHNEFHEQCIERIFMDIQRACMPTELTVYGRYTRRGGLDINPFRTTLQKASPANVRLVRQ